MKILKKSKKITKVFTILGFVFATSISSNCQVFSNDMQKLVEVDPNVEYQASCQTSDGGFAIVSSESSHVFQLTRTDAAYNVISSEFISCIDNPSLGISSQDLYLTPKCIYQTEDGGFAISGSSLSEATPSNSGGFLMKIDKRKGGGYAFDWMRVFKLQDNYYGSLDGVIELDKGFIAIANYLTVGSVSSSKVIRTDKYGNVIWSKVFSANKFSTPMSIKFVDMVKIQEKRVAILGDCNGFPADERDINIVILNSKGHVLSNNIYESLDSVTPVLNTHKEQAFAMDYNSLRDELVVVGEVSKKKRNQCVLPIFQDMLTFGVDVNSGSVNWSTKHELDAVFNDVCFTGGKRSKSAYAITGTINDDQFNTTGLSNNGFILRLNDMGYSRGIRYYGDDGDDRLSSIYNNKDGVVAIGATDNLVNQFGKKGNLFVQSYDLVKGTCHSLNSKIKSVYHPFIKTGFGLHEDCIVTYKDIEFEILSSIFEEKFICYSQVLFLQPHLGDKELFHQSEVKSLSMENTKVYPTVVNDGVVNIINNTGLTSYFLATIEGRVLPIKGSLKDGDNKLKLGLLNNGFYRIVCFNKTGGKESYMIKIE